MYIREIIQRLNNNSLAKDSFWALFGSAIGKGLSLLAGIAVARFLGKDVYGEYGMIKNTLLMIAIFSSFGLGYTATKFIAECKSSESYKIIVIHRTATVITLIVSSFIAGLLILFAPSVSIWLDAPHLSGILRLSAIAIIFNAVKTTQIGELAGFNAYRIIAINSTITGVFTFILSVGLAWYYGINGAVTALVLSLILNCILNYKSLKQIQSHLTNTKYSATKNILKEIMKFSFPVALQESLYSITHWCSSFLLIKLGGYGELGLSSAAGQWMAVLLFVPGALRNVALSYLSNSNTDKIKNKHILKQLLTVNFISTFIPFLIIAILGKWICSWYGPTYIGLQCILNVSIASTIINSLTNVYTQELMAHNKNWYLFTTRLVRDCGILTATYFIVLEYGSAALSYAIISLLFQCIYLLTLWTKYKYSFDR